MVVPLAALAANLRKLKVICKSKGFGDIGAELLAVKLPALTHLDLSTTYYSSAWCEISFKGFKAIAHGLASLRSLCLSNKLLNSRKQVWGLRVQSHSQKSHRACRLRSPLQSTHFWLLPRSSSLPAQGQEDWNRFSNFVVEGKALWSLRPVLEKIDLERSSEDHPTTRQRSDSPIHFPRECWQIHSRNKSESLEARH